MWFEGRVCLGGDLGSFRISLLVSIEVPFHK